MSSDRDPVVVPPGEDPLELPAALGWLVERCTRMRRLFLVLAEFHPRARRRRGSAAGAPARKLA
jgi:hypothetical protein